MDFVNKNMKTKDKQPNVCMTQTAFVFLYSSENENPVVFVVQRRAYVVRKAKTKYTACRLKIKMYAQGRRGVTLILIIDCHQYSRG